MVMNMNPFIVVIHANILHIQLPMYHDNDDIVTHIQQLIKICVTNGEDTDDHKLQYFPNSLIRKTIDWFARYERTHLVTTWDEVQRLSLVNLVKFVAKDK
jgi:hypothetical protein